MSVITASDLASYLRDQALRLDDSFNEIAALADALVSEEWANPVDPVPARIKLLALTVGARAWVNDPSKAHLDSVTRSIDDATRTERYRSAGDNAAVYLTTEELAVLRGSGRVRSVRLIKPGDRV